MANSFTGTNIRVGNTGCRSVIDEIMNFRTQVTRKGELRTISGWSDSLNQILAEGLGRIRSTLALVTDDPSDAAGSSEDATDSSAGQAARQAAREADAKDEAATLRDLFQAGHPITTDDVQMPANFSSGGLPYDFSGADRNHPQMSDPKFENVFLKQFVITLDDCVRDTSNLACSENGDVIPASQSAMVHARLNTAFTILQTKGGRANMPRIADGTDAETLAGKVGPEVVAPPAEAV